MATSTFVDFQKLKERVGIGELIPMLNLLMRQSGEQFRGPCPACNAGGDRALVITPKKGAFYCFAAKKGGDLIGLVAHIQGIGAKEAAQAITEFTGKGTVPYQPPERSPRPQPGEEKETPTRVRTINPLEYLQAEQEAVQALGVSPETARHFEAGYAPKGILRGRLAAPIYTLGGELVAYVGIAVNPDQVPALLFPNGWDHRPHLFNATKAEEADLLYVAKTPLEVLLAFENGVQNVVSFLGEITSGGLQALSLLMDERQTPAVEFL